MISDEERNRRLDLNGSELRIKIASAGAQALLRIVKDESIDQSKREEICDDLRFVADCWLDNNGDVIDKATRERQFRRKGIYF